MVLAVMCFMLFAASPILAQEWSPAQKEVWKVLEEGTLMWNKGNLDEVYKYVHRDFVWWNYGTPVPMSFESAKRFDALWLKHNKVLEYELKPLTILVYDTFAVVNYVWAGFISEDGGSSKYSTSRNTKVYKKEGARWFLVANHDGSYSALK